MNIETISVQGTGEWNEDALVVNERLKLYGVLDGATSLQPYRGPGGETGGYLASRTIKEYLESLSEGDVAETSLKQLAVQANIRLRQKMADAGIDLTDKAALWTSGLALIRVREHAIDFAQTGDCMIAAKYEDGSVRTISRDHVEHIDLQSKKIWLEGIRSGITSREQLWNMVKPVILQNKSKMNTLEGYSVISGEPEAAELVEYGTINRIRLEALLLVTDGLFLPKETDLAPAGMDSLVEQIESRTLSGYADWLINLEQDDKECQRYPRFKISDDKTGIWLKFA
ncbi:protein phosphatase 2C domain-containing protein [Paenibacillus hamazuiensis]|uniref:protein phosphatase 2C domain-containing protein n=1 Tax=Paenibacillus hamazuiensis TaxID=2936508 RepID=UPI00200DBFCA|nr:protein phosphatase 2C domain-containing protein [Paenibacillus hamazuiensis]